MNVRYIFGALVSLPLLPLLYWQGKKVRSSVPQLPEAKGVEGSAAINRSNRIRLIAIGESTIAGVGVETHEEGFTGALARELAVQLQVGVDWKVYARSGYTAIRVKQKIVPRISDLEADLIVIGLGGNDAFTLNKPSKWIQHIKQLIDSLQAKFPAVPIVFANMPPIKTFPAFTSLIKFILGNLVEIHGAELKKLVDTLPNVYYNSDIITLEDWIVRLNITADPSDFFSDGVHPSKLTYQAWGTDLAQFIYRKQVLLRN